MVLGVDLQTRFELVPRPLPIPFLLQRDTEIIYGTVGVQDSSLTRNGNAGSLRPGLLSLAVPPPSCIPLSSAIKIQLSLLCLDFPPRRGEGGCPLGRPGDP